MYTKGNGPAILLIFSPSLSFKDSNGGKVFRLVNKDTGLRRFRGLARFRFGVAELDGFSLRRRFLILRTAELRSGVLLENAWTC